ncbi:FAR1-related protein, partial [Trifolium medium]|nr:FAR1-related protein [Trifolium medium]
MNDSNAIEEPKVAEQRDVDATPADESRNVVVLKIDFRIQFTTGKKFDERGQMHTWVSDLAYSLGFVSVIAKSDNAGNGRKGYVHIGCQRG